MRSETVHDDSDTSVAEPADNEYRDPPAESDSALVTHDRPEVVEGEAVTYDHDAAYDGDAVVQDPATDPATPDPATYQSDPAVPDPATYDAEPVAATAPVAGATDPTSPQGAYASPADRADDGFGSSWPADTVTDLQDRWREIQLQFVDDPRNAAGEAQELLDRALSEYSRVMAARKSELDGWRDGDAGQSDTEQMRLVLRRYRDMLDQLLAR